MTKSNDDKLVNNSIGNHNVAGIADFIDLLLFDLEVDTNTIEPIYAHKLQCSYRSFRRGYGSSNQKVIFKKWPTLDHDCDWNRKRWNANSASPSPEEDVDGWYDATADHWVERTNNFFEIVEYFGHIICVSEEIYNSLTALNLRAKLVYWKPRFTGMREIFERGEEFFKNYWIKQNVKHTKTHRLMFSGSWHLTGLNKLINWWILENGLGLQTDLLITLVNFRQSGLSFGPKHYRSTVQLSKMRLLWCLNNFFPIIMQDCQGKTDLDPYYFIQMKMIYWQSVRLWMQHTLSV